MRVFFDTSILVDLDRQRDETLQMLERASRAGHEFLISTVSVSEIFSGAYLQRDAEAAAARARRALGQFQWQDLDGEAALRTGQISAYLISHGRRLEYADTAIAGCFLSARGDVLVTDNKAHFESIPALTGRVLTTKEAAKALGKKP